MPSLKMLLKVSTINKYGHIEWGNTFEPTTAAALRKRIVAQLNKMIENPEYPTSRDAPLQTTTEGPMPPPDPPRVLPSVHYVEIPAVQSHQQNPSVENAKKKKVHMYAYTS